MLEYQIRLGVAPENRKFVLRRLLWVAMALVMFVGMPSPSSDQAYAIPVIKKKTTTPQTDPKTCNVTDDLVRDWIVEDKLTEDLNLAYKALADSLSGLDDDRFGHKNATNIIDTRDTVSRTVNRHRRELWALAQKVVSNRIPACDDCAALNNWGKIRQIGKWTGDDKLGNTVIVDATLAQMNDKDVIKEVNDYLILRDMSSDRGLGQYKDKATKAQRERLDNECADELNNASKAQKPITEIDKTRCTADYLIREIMVATAQEIGKKLDAVTLPTGDKTMKSLKNTTCLPITNYQFMFQALQAVP